MSKVENKNNEIAEKFINRITGPYDSLSKIITINLFCENAINRLIQEKAYKVKDFKSNNDFIPISKAAYSIKLYFAYSLDLINDKLYENLRLLNHWRNQVAHNVNIEIRTLSMNFHLFDERDKVISPNMEEKDLILALAFVTYVELHQYIDREFKISL